MKKFYSIFVVSGIYLSSEYGECSSWDIYSEGHAVTPYDGRLFETEEAAEQYLEKVLSRDNEYKDSQFIIQKVYVRN